MVDSKTKLERTKNVQPVWTILRGPRSSTNNSRSTNIENENDYGTLQSIIESIWWRHLLAGGLAGAVSRTATAPFDRVKIYTQVHAHSMGIVSVLKFLIHHGGVPSLWRGNLVNVIKIAPESATKFTAYEKIKRLMRTKENGELAIYQRFIAGATAGGIAQTFVFPLEVIKVRLALNLSNEEHSIRKIAENVYNTGGIRSLYRGYSPHMMGSVLYAGIELTIYEHLKRRSTRYLDPDDEPSLLMLFACSSLSTVMGQFFVYPFGLIRTRLQAGPTEKIKLIAAFRQIIEDKGFRGLYRGMTANILKVVPTVSINFVVYEYISHLLGVEMT